MPFKMFLCVVFARLLLSGQSYLTGQLLHYYTVKCNQQIHYWFYVAASHFVSPHSTHGCTEYEANEQKKEKHLHWIWFKYNVPERQLFVYENRFQLYCIPFWSKRAYATMKNDNSGKSDMKTTMEHNTSTRLNCNQNHFLTWNFYIAHTLTHTHKHALPV